MWHNAISGGENAAEWGFCEKVVPLTLHPSKSPLPVGSNQNV